MCNHVSKNPKNVTGHIQRDEMRAERLTYFPHTDFLPAENPLHLARIDDPLPITVCGGDSSLPLVSPPAFKDKVLTDGHTKTGRLL